MDDERFSALVAPHTDVMARVAAALVGVNDAGDAAQEAQENFSGGVLFAWKPSDAAWRQLAPPFTQEVGTLTPVASTTPGADTLYAVMVNRGEYRPTPQSGVNQPSGTRSTYSFLRYDP